MRLQRYYQEILTSSQESSRVSIILGWSPQYSTGTGCQENKARNSHKPLLGEYVQQGNISRSITYIVKGVPFSSFIKKIVSKNNLKKVLVLRYVGY